jgi:hypothetical protein
VLPIPWHGRLKAILPQQSFTTHQFGYTISTKPTKETTANMLMSIKTILFALVAACLMVSTFASGEIEKRAVTIPLNQQRCISHSYGLIVNYDIRVGREFTNAKCNEAYNNLKKMPISMWSCKRLGGGHMRIVFNNMNGFGGTMNEALTKTFPYIGRVMPFACNGRIFGS